MLDFEELESLEAKASCALAVAEGDSLEDSCFQASARCVESLLQQGPPALARAVAVFGPGVLVLPFYGHMVGMSTQKSWRFAAHVQEGFLDAICLKLKFGQCDPQRIIDELAMDASELELMMQDMSDGRLRQEVADMQDWRRRALGHLRTLERRAAWAFLGMREGSATQAQVRRAFKQKALELHPDKGGDPERFQLLQEMRRLLWASVSVEATTATAEEAVPASDQQRGDETEHGDSDPEDSFPAASAEDADADAEEEDFVKNASTKLSALAALAELKREELEARRLRLHRSVRDLWLKSGVLAKEIGSTEMALSAPMRDCVKLLRRFLDGSVKGEVGRCYDAAQASSTLMRFLERGAELVCCAGLSDAASTVAEVSLHLTIPLLTVSSRAGFVRLCAGLLEGAQAVPAIGDACAAEVERAIAQRTRALRSDAESRQLQREQRLPQEQQSESDVPAPQVVAAIDSQVALQKEAGPPETVSSNLKASSALCMRWSRSSLAEWSHPCAGYKLPDGSAVYCAVCGTWVHLQPRFDPEEFKVHCQHQTHAEKVAASQVKELLHQASRHGEGDYGWID